jgi:glutamate/tyrosine decarboxylase-like PLP-dependent enzyme
MDKPDWNEALEPAVRAALQFLDQLPERPVGPRASAEQMLAVLRAPLPQEGTAAGTLVRELVELLDPGLSAMPGGRFFGWVIGGALPAALAADWLVSAWDQNAGMADGTPSAAAIEQVALEWIKEVLGLPAVSSGALVTGAQMANTTCLAAARHRVLAAQGWDVEADGLAGAPRVNLVAGAERHDTVMRSLRMLGFGVRSVQHVATDGQGRLRAAELASLLRTLTGPTIVCAQAGNVNTGAVDPMAEIADLTDGLRERVGRASVWLHVDGAFGLWARAAESLRGPLQGVERADSWATDAHKWLNTPYDCGIAIVADSAAHRGAMTVRAAYLPDPDAQAVRSPVEFTPDFSRRARGLVVYAALRSLGRRGVQELIERSCRLARRFGDALRGHSGIEVMNEIVLNQVLVRFRDPRGNDDDGHTRAVISRVQAEGTCFMSGTVFQGRAAMRISVSNWSTDETDVDRSIESLLRAHRFEA